MPTLAMAATGYTWKSVQALGGGFIDGIHYHPAQRGLCYIRTDMGGAYRWDGTNSLWIPLNDYLTRSQADSMGVLSLALDPNNVNKVYMMCGKYTQSWAGMGVLQTSSDQGATWTQTTLGVKVGGNEDGRGAGERLQVDPNLGSILFMGSTADGLWKSTNSGASFTKIAAFPGLNVNFVLFDASSSSLGTATQRIFAGVNNTGGSSLYRSNDGGATWAVVASQPSGQMALRASRSGSLLYLAYSDQPGPNGSTAGAIWKYNISTGAWTNVSPPAGQGGYGGVCVDPQDPNTVVVSTLDRWSPRDEVLRSTNGGISWTAVLVNATWDRTKAPWTSNSSPHWLTDVQIDPFNRNKAIFVTGYGLWMCSNLLQADSALPTTWAFEDKGIEQTVPTQLISPPSGAPLLTAMGDIDGFKHDNLDISPPAGRHSPNVGTTLAIAFAESTPTKMVKAYNASPYGGYSTDGGASWTAFASSPAGANGGGTRSIAISPNGTNIVWCPSNAACARSVNNGGAWTASTGGMPNGLEPVADRVNSNKFYAVDALTGNVWVSTNGGAAFAIAATGLPTLPSYLLGDASLKTVFGIEGEIWLCLGANGLYHSTNSGTSFAKVATVTQAYDVGTGMKAPAGSYPAVFIQGTVSGTNGFYRSDDTAATWVRINDDQHNYGYVHDISGDPRVYGRMYGSAEGRGAFYAEMNAGTPTVTPTKTYSNTATRTATPSPTSSPTPGALVTIVVSGFTFNPSQLTITAGTSVQWQNLSPGHNVAQVVNDTATTHSAGFYSGALGSVATFTQAFPAVGTYYYICEGHVGLNMRGVIFVLPAGTPTNTPTSSRTVSPSPTTTASPTRTASSSAPATPAAATATVTPTRTWTSTVAVPTATATPTSSSTLTVSRSVTQTLTVTSTSSSSRTASATLSRTVSPTITATDSPVPPGSTETDTPTISPTHTHSPTATPSASPSPSLTASQTLSTTASPTATSTLSSTATATGTVSPGASATTSPTLSPQQSPTMTSSATLTVTPSSSATRTQVPAAATATMSPTRTATAPGSSSGPLKIEAQGLMPNPNPLWVYVKLSAPADKITVKLWTKGMLLVGVAEGGAAAKGWASVALGAELLAKTSNGLYYYTVTASANGVTCKALPPGKLLILR